MQHKLASTKLSIFALKHQFHVTTGERTFSVLEHLLHLAMRADNTAAGLSVLAECTADVRQWYMQNGLAGNYLYPLLGVVHPLLTLTHTHTQTAPHWGVCSSDVFVNSVGF